MSMYRPDAAHDTSLPTPPTLQQIWETLNAQGKGSDKGSYHSYIEVYESILAPYRFTAKHVLEIGLFNGYSLLMWEDYFTRAQVCGIDCDEQPHGGMADLRPLIEKCHCIFIGNAESNVDAEKFFSKKKFDVIVEDGNHNIESQILIYNNMKKYLNDGAVYIIEDIENIDETRERFEAIDSKKTVEVIDRRNVKGRFDDVIVIIK